MQAAQHNAAEVDKLKEMLTQRDNEISILWNSAANLVSFLLENIEDD